MNLKNIKKIVLKKYFILVVVCLCLIIIGVARQIKTRPIVTEMKLSYSEDSSLSSGPSLYLILDIESEKDSKILPDFSIDFNGKNIFNYEDMYQVVFYDPQQPVGLYMYKFEKPDITRLKYELVFTLQKSEISALNTVSLKTKDKNCKLKEASFELTQDETKIEENVANLYKLLELISYYQEQVSMDYKNVYLAYSGYNKFLQFLLEARLDPGLVNNKVQFVPVQSKLKTTLENILEELYFDAQRKYLLSNDQVSKERYYELLVFYKNNHLLQSLDIEDILAGG